MFHLTHRCHNRAFLLKFARDRNAYRAKLREHVGRFNLWLLEYCVTSNHVHLLVDAEDRMEVSAFMREVAGEFAWPKRWRERRCGGNPAGRRAWRWAAPGLWKK